MNPASRSLQPAFWIGIPALVCIVATIIFALPMRVAAMQMPEPVFGLAPAFAWAMIRPSVLPAVALLLLGLFQDLLWNTPLGFWPLCLLSVQALTLIVRASLSGQSYWVLWGWFGAGCALAFGVGVVLSTIASGTVPALTGVAAQWLVSAALYPFADHLINRYDDADVRFR